MNVGFNNPYVNNYNNNKVAFRSNQGFLLEIETFKKDFGDTESVGRLQLHAQTANKTPEFLKQVETAAGDNKKVYNFLLEILADCCKK